MLTKDLQSLGFPKNLAHVYQALAELGGQAKAGEIIKKTDLHRNIVYVCLDKLTSKQLITKVEERGVASYKLLDSTRLMNEVREKEQLTLNIMEELDALKKHPQTQEIIVHEGLEGFRNFSFSSLQKINQGEVLRVIGSIGDKWYQCMGEKNYEKYKQIQTKKQIRWDMVLYSNSEMDSKLAKENPELCQIKLVPQNNNNPASIIIFGDTVALQIFTDPISVIEIKNKALAEVYLNHFNYLWNSNNWTLRGEEGVRTFMNDTLKYSDVYWIGGNGGVEKFFPQVWNEYKSKRIEKKVFWHDLVTPDATLSSSEPGQTIYNETYYEYKILPATLAGPHVICLYGNKIANIVWQNNGMINVVEDKETVESYKKYFNYLWNQEVQSYRGVKEIESILLTNLYDGYTHDCFGAGYGDGSEKQRQFIIKFFVNYSQKIAHLKPKMRLIFFEQFRSESANEVNLWNSHVKENTQLRFLPPQYYTPMETHVFANKVILVFWFDEPIATVYTNPEIIEAYKKQFSLLWDTAKK